MKRGFTLLLCEDNANERLLFSRVLEEASSATGIPIRLEIAEDGDEGIDYLSGAGRFGDRKSYPFPDLVVLDLKMPRVDGVEVLRWLKDHPEYRQIPKVMISGSAQERDIEAAYQQGVNSYFQKPRTLQELRVLVRNLVSYWAQTERPRIKRAA